jgi:cytochrome c biogenesis protein CcmG, thiol:disulfide interchange protein DsbE
MTSQQAFAAKLVLLGFVAFFIIFFSQPRGQYAAPALGETVPNFTLRNDDGKVVALGDYRGQVVVLNFWATWCPPCIEEMPSLNRLAEHYEGKGLVVIGLSVDEDADAYSEFLASNQIKFLTLRDAARNTSDRYGTRRFPETYIINREGRRARKVIGSLDWTGPQMISYLDELLAKEGS